MPYVSELNVLLGGACGFKGTNQYPFSSMTSCGNEPIFKDGKGCGSCYQVGGWVGGVLTIHVHTYAG
jgi:hypothetical protein